MLYLSFEKYKEICKNAEESTAKVRGCRIREAKKHHEIIKAVANLTDWRDWDVVPDMFIILYTHKENFGNARYPDIITRTDIITVNKQSVRRTEKSIIIDHGNGLSDYDIFYKKT